MDLFMCCFSGIVMIVTNVLFCEGFAFSDQGKWDFNLNEEQNNVRVVKSLFKESETRIQILCDSSQPVGLKVSWTLTEVTCWQDYLRINEVLTRYDYSNELEVELDKANYSTIHSGPENHNCSEHNILLEEVVFNEDVQFEKAGVHGMPVDPETIIANNNKGGQQMQQLKHIHTQQKSSSRVVRVPKDGFYMLALYLDSESQFTAEIHIEMRGKHGYLSAADWPLLPFYGAMCLVYVVLGLAWLIVSFLQWRDLLRVQFWIGGVILLGMLEKAMFYAEYQSINMTGQSVASAVLAAELVSCGKRTVARMLVIIVSLGFGIVKPRLGALLHRTVATGILYFLLAASEAYLRIMRPKSDAANQMFIATVPLAVLDSAICWWIFTSLVQTTRTLRLRRNIVKLNLYRHFTNTLVFAVVSSVIFMLYSIKSHLLVPCYTAWKELWVEDAFWKLLFSVILLVIMILWRPTNNNQRYAFTPLLDAPEDGDDEEEEYFVSDVYGVKMRGGLNSGASSPKPKISTNSAEDDLKWVEENIPTSLADSALPILDSDEEVMNIKFELSKMQ